jgi:hypothetical protein
MPTLIGETPAMRGLNVQFPFARMLVQGYKTVELRRYPLGSRGLPEAGRPMFVIETPGAGARALPGVLTEDVPDDLLDPPRRARVVGVVAFASSTRYDSQAAFNHARAQHRVGQGGQFDWNGASALFAWQVQTARLLESFVDAADVAPRQILGWLRPVCLSEKRTHEATFETDNADRSKRRRV